MQQSIIGQNNCDRREITSSTSSASFPPKHPFFQRRGIERRQVTDPNSNPNSNPYPSPKLSPSPSQLPNTYLTTSIGKQKSILALASTTIAISSSAAATSEGSNFTSIEHDASTSSDSSPNSLDFSRSSSPVLSPVSSPDSDAAVTIALALEKLGILDAKLVNKYHAEFINSDANDESGWWNNCCCGFCLLLDNGGHDFVVIEQGNDATTGEEKQSRPKSILNNLHENLIQAWIFLSSIRLCPLIGFDGEKDYIDADAVDDADNDDNVLYKRKNRKSSHNNSPTLHQNLPPRLSWSSANYNTVAPALVVISTVVNKICDTSHWNSVSEIELTTLKSSSIPPHKDDRLQNKVEDDDTSDLNLSTASEFSLLSEDENGVNRYPFHQQEVANGGEYSGFQIYYTAADCGDGDDGSDGVDIKYIKHSDDKLCQDPSYGFIYDIDSGKHLTTDEKSHRNNEKQYVSVKDAGYDWLIVK